MGKPSNETSGEVSGQQDQNSVYDFLYHDARRVGSFLAQLDPDGHLQTYSTSVGTTHTKRTQSARNISLGMKDVASGGRDSEREYQKDVDQSAARTYDPLWANALALLDHLQQRAMLTSNVHVANVGQFVLATGPLKVLNVKLLESIWGTSAASQMNALNTAALSAQEQVNNLLGLEIIQRMPHMIQAQLLAQQEPASLSWMALDEDNLIVPASTLMMKYGPWIGGDWSVLAIKDAELDNGPVIDAELGGLMGGDWEAAADARSSTPFALLAEMIAPIARRMMGRPAGFYGLTPVLIFREVNAAQGPVEE